MFRSSLYDSHAGRCANDIYYNVDVIRACYIADIGRGSEIDVQVQVISPASSSSPSPSTLLF